MSLPDRRRRADLERLRGLITANPNLLELLSVEGDPPHRVRLGFSCTAPIGFANATVQHGERHSVEINFTERYPLEPPLVYLRTPVFNPHIFPHTHRICLGAQWSAAESMDVFIQRLWAIMVWDPMILDPSSPANLTAMHWAEAHRQRLPFDTRRLRGADAPTATPRPKMRWREAG